MRAIKFRAWDNTPQVMYSWEKLLELDTDGALMISDLLKDGWRGQAIPMQYTGLEDKNDKEIYEGDIVRWQYAFSPRTYKDIIEYHDKVIEIGYERDETRFVGFILHSCVATYSGDYYSSITEQPLEVIGNIYENPELLEE